MKTNFYRYFLSGIVSIVALISCDGLVEEPAYKAESNAQASLSLNMTLPVEIAGTKSIANDPRNSSNTWSEWEKFADGSLLYNLTLFVVDSENRLVGYRQIHANSTDVNSLNGFYDGNTVNTAAATGTGVKITFPQSDPLHGNVELLRAGTYTIIAVANHAAVTSGSNSYPGLGNAQEDGSNNYNGTGDFNTIVSSIISSFQPAQGIQNFNSSNYTIFFNYRLNSGDDRVCRMNPQPLVMIRKVTLAEGNNNVQCELSRTFARVRLDVYNKSTSTILDVSSLSFNGSFASKNAYLLNDVEAGTANYFSNFSLYEGNTVTSDNTKGVLDVNSADAIVSASSSQTRIIAGATDPIFDAYILEGKINASAQYAFTFTGTYAAKMEDGDATHNVMIGSFFSNSKYNGSSGSGGGYYGMTSYGIIDPAFYIFIRSQASNVSTCLMADIQSMTAKVANTQAGNEQNSSGFKMSPEFIWEMVIPGGSNSVEYENSNSGYPFMGTNYVQSAPGYLKSISTNLYVQPYDGRSSKVPVLGSEPGNLIFKMDFGSEDEQGTVYCQYNGSYYCLNGSTCEWVSVPNMSDYKRLTFETIIAEPVSPKSAQIESFIQQTSSTGATVRKDEIVRNDFFHGIIPVNIQN